MRNTPYKMYIYAIKTLGSWFDTTTTTTTPTGSRPRFPLRSHSLVHSENNSYFLEIGPIRDIELICIFRPVSFVCTLYQIQV